jgi:serine/threonine protein kinase
MIKTIIPNGISATIIHIAQDINTKRMVALKELRKEKFKHDFNYELAKTELMIHYSLSKLSNNIVDILDYYEDEKSFYLLMEFCDEPNYFEDILENVTNLYYIILFYLILFFFTSI